MSPARGRKPRAAATPRRRVRHDRRPPTSSSTPRPPPHPTRWRRRRHRPRDRGDAVRTIDLVEDELALARAQLTRAVGARERNRSPPHRRARGRRHDRDEELDALRFLLCRGALATGRLVGAPRRARRGAAVECPAPLPIVLLIEAESLAAAGEPDRAAGALDARHRRSRGRTRMRFGRRPGSPHLAAAGRAHTVAVARAPAMVPAADETDATGGGGRGAAAARSARGGHASPTWPRHRTRRFEMSIAFRLDHELAPTASRSWSPRSGGQTNSERLLLYGRPAPRRGAPRRSRSAFDRRGPAELIAPQLHRVRRPRRNRPKHQEPHFVMQRTLVLAKPIRPARPHRRDHRPLRAQGLMSVGGAC